MGFLAEFQQGMKKEVQNRSDLLDDLAGGGCVWRIRDDANHDGFDLAPQDTCEAGACQATVQAVTRGACTTHNTSLV